MDGVIVPAVESAAQVAALVDAARLPPVGHRSTGLSRSTVVGSQGQPLLLPMVETRAGLEALDEITAAPGIDGIFVGPYDLALSLGQPSSPSAPVLDGSRSLADTAHARGRLAGLFAGSPELAERFADGARRVP